MADQVADALRLRTWAVQVLSAGWRTPPDVDVGAWKLFLRAERCAIALSTRAEGDAPPLLHAAATVEWQRILSARAQIDDLGRLASRMGLRVIVLKGGFLSLRSNGAVDLDDVDVLTEPGRQEMVAAFLDQSGYTVLSGGDHAHLGGRGTPNAVPVEVHFTLRELGDLDRLWQEARPIATRDGLWRLSPAHHVRHVLVHAVETHPYRRSTLRDLLVIGIADDELEGAERRALDGFVDQHRAPLMLRRTLDAARALRAGTLAPGMFRTDAGAHYALLTRRISSVDRWLGSQVGRRVFAQLGDRQTRRAYWRTVWDGGGRSPWGILEALGRRWPILARWIRRVLRLMRAPLVNLVAAPLVHRARALERSPHPSTDKGASTFVNTDGEA